MLIAGPSPQTVGHLREDAAIPAFHIHGSAVEQGVSSRGGGQGRGARREAPTPRVLASRGLTTREVRGRTTPL